MVDKKNICLECGQERPGDARVENGMKCGICAGYFERGNEQEKEGKSK